MWVQLLPGTLMKKFFRALRVARDLAGLALSLGRDVADAVRGKKRETHGGYDSP